jgi:hypothetical protein
MQHVMQGFKKMIGLPCIQGAIDVVQIHIHKPKLQAYATNYYSSNQNHIICNYKLL